MTFGIGIAMKGVRDAGFSRNRSKNAGSGPYPSPLSHVLSRPFSKFLGTSLIPRRNYSKNPKSVTTFNELTFFHADINQSEFEDSFKLASDWIKSVPKNLNKSNGHLVVKQRLCNFCCCCCCFCFRGETRCIID